MFKIMNPYVSSAFVLATSILFSNNVFANSLPAGTVLISKGSVLAVGAQNQKRSLSRGSKIYAGEKITTQANSDVQIRFSDDGIVSLRPNTEYEVNSYEFKGANDKKANIAATLVKGKMLALTGAITKENPKGYTVKTKLATIGITGTEFATELTNKIQTLEVYHGTVDFIAKAGSLSVGSDSPYNAAMVAEASGVPIGFDSAPPLFSDPEEVSDEEIQNELFDPDIMLEDSFYESYELGVDEDLVEDDLDEADDAMLEEDLFDEEDELL